MLSVDYKIRDKQDPRPVERILFDYVSNKFSVILLCGSTEFVYDIMKAAHKNGFLNGEYVFINFDLYAQVSLFKAFLKWVTRIENNRNFISSCILLLILTILKMHSEDR